MTCFLRAKAERRDESVKAKKEREKKEGGPPRTRRTTLRGRPQRPKLRRNEPCRIGKARTNGFFVIGKAITNPRCSALVLRVGTGALASPPPISTLFSRNRASAFKTSKIASPHCLPQVQGLYMMPIVCTWHLIFVAQFSHRFVGAHAAMPRSPRRGSTISRSPTSSKKCLVPDLLGICFPARSLPLPL